jgi:transcriptional regulator with XRE-family HTH domain
MQPGQEMTDDELQEAAREVLEGQGASQSDAARALGMHRSTVSKALGHDPPSRYAGTLRRIIEAYTDFRIDTETETTHVHRVRPKT